MICQLGSSFRERGECFWSGVTDIWSRYQLWSCWASFGWLCCGKGSSDSTHYASQNTLSHQMQTPKWHVQSCSSITFLTLVIQSTILQEANATGNVRYWRRDYGSGEWGGGRVFSNTKVSCLEIKASTAVWLVLSKYKVQTVVWVNVN